MPQKKPAHRSRLSLAPLTREQKLAGLTRINPADLTKLESDAEVETPPKPPRKGLLRTFIVADYATKKGRKK
jgi:hypothetical protein